jgi:indole-3-glycerol phosphate synthase
MGAFQPVASDFLTTIIAQKQREVAVARRDTPVDALRLLCERQPAPLPVLPALRGTRLAVIAEIKRGSPSAGVFDAGLDAAAQAVRYAEAGAAAVSVLTDGPFFHGSLEDLRQVRRVVAVPLLRKDFLIDEYQLLEARACGADMVLLIVAALEETLLDALLTATARLGMTALVEVSTAAEAARALAAGAELVGINNRNLHTFVVDMATTECLRPLLPPSVVVAALSGIHDVAGARRMREAGADAVLVGEALVRAEDPQALIEELRGLL